MNSVRPLIAMPFARHKIIYRERGSFVIDSLYVESLQTESLWVDGFNKILKIKISKQFPNCLIITNLLFKAHITSNIGQHGQSSYRLVYQIVSNET